MIKKQQFVKKNTVSNSFIKPWIVGIYKTDWKRNFPV